MKRLKQRGGRGVRRRFLAMIVDLNCVAMLIMPASEIDPRIAVGFAEKQLFVL